MRITLLVAALVVIGLSAARAAPDATYMGGGQIVRVADEKFENIPAGAAVTLKTWTLSSERTFDRNWRVRKSHSK